MYVVFQIIQYSCVFQCVSVMLWLFKAIVIVRYPPKLQTIVWIDTNKSSSDIYRRQILTSKVDPHIKRVNYVKLQ